MISELADLGLDGPAQVHVAPVVLAIDVRAHQVFTGFADQTEDVARAVTARYGNAAVLRARVDGEWRQVGLDALRGADLIVIPALEQDHGGGMSGLRWVVDRLLGPGGCPWDQAQTHETLRKHLIEECYELVEAIDRQDAAAMREELGDVLLQPVMHAQMMARDGGPDIDAIAEQITAKLIRRHPHVFGEVSVADEGEVLRNWEAIKREERSGTAKDSALAGIPGSMPALLRALEISKRAARLGFEWPDFEAVWDKFHEEEAELREALAGGDSERIAAEFGDLLFTVVNLARWAKIDPEDALRGMLDRFTARFRQMETRSEVPLDELSPDEWDRLWNEAKAAVG